RVQAAKRREGLGEMRELVGHRAQLGARCRGALALTEKKRRLFHVAAAQTFDGTERADEMSLRGLLRDRDQRVRHAGERRHDDDGSLVGARSDDAPRSRDRFGVADRRAAELEDDHNPSSSPRRAISSAFSTEAPAAPRITLCPIATNFTSKTGSGRMRPTVTVMPPPRSTCRLGCGWSGDALTSSGCSGALGKPRATSAPRQPAIASLTSSGLALRESPTDITTVCPCSRGTRWACALTGKSALYTVAPSLVPRNLRTSPSIFGSSSPMYGITLPRMSSDATPG